MQRQDVRGFVRRDPLQSVRPWDVQRIRREVALMELETQRFYTRAAELTADAELRQLLGDLAEEERRHEVLSSKFDPAQQAETEQQAEAETSRQLFLLQVVQPGLVGLMDGSVSTLAPLFAAAFATKDCWQTFLVGLAASVGAGISMGFAEALSDDGSLTGRGHPYLRGVICGMMTLLGGIFHALPYLIPQFLDRHDRIHDDRGGGIVFDRLDSQPLHGEPLRHEHHSGGGRRVLVFLAGILIGIS